MPKYLCAPLALAVLLAAGCGDSAPSKKEYVADLNKICKETAQKIQKTKQPPQTLKGIASYARETRPILRDSIKKAEDLELPDEQGNEFKAYVDASKASLRESDNLQKAADSGNPRAVSRVLIRTDKGNKARGRQAKKLGLTSCGSG